jgi:LysM domain
MQTWDRRRLLGSFGLLMGAGALEGLLTRIVGPPSGDVHALAGLVSPMAEPLEGILAALALAAHALAAYLVLVLGLRTLAHLPGLAGRAAHHAERVFTVPAVRRGLDALVGGVLIVQLALAPTATGVGPGSLHARPPAVAMATEPFLHRSWPHPARPAATTAGRAPGGPATTASSPPIPLPIWLGGGPASAGAADGPSRSQAAPAVVRHTIAPGDTLWSISAAHLRADARTEPMIAAYWRRIYQANRHALGSDPSLIHPGTTLSVPLYTPSAAAPVSPGASPATAFARPPADGVVEHRPDRLP